MVKKFNIELTEKQLEVLSAALCELPYKHSASVIAHIQNQVQYQLTNHKPASQESPKDDIFAGD